MIEDNNWNLWPDTSAEWETDDLFLPGEFIIADLPVNPPTGGWEILNTNISKSISLPSTVEQHYWGEFGLRNYENEYYFEKSDTLVKNGNYKGVSWWWKEIEIPQSFRGKLIFLNIRAARLIAEVYLNETLVGYNIITETAFNCDITKAAMLGEKNILAIRITNPGGQMDWLDTKLHGWGKYEFHFGHGFGGLDRGITISSHEPVYIDDLWIANTADPENIIAHLDLQNTLGSAADGELIFEIYKNENPALPVITLKKKFSIDAESNNQMTQEIRYQDAVLWDLENPNLYKIKASIKLSNSKTAFESSVKTFGFRSFTIDGIGENAILKLNDKRIRLISAISWGFWGFNGLFPTPALAEREVNAAKSFGMNCIQFHRNIGKTEALDAHDRLGLFRYMEPGGGQSALGKEYSLYSESPKSRVDISGKNGTASTFAEKYMEEKLIRMIKDHRSHPSLIMYSIQNEINPDLNNPRIFHLIRRMHEEDPSRVVMLKSGIPPNNQVWMAPYDTTVYYDQGDGYSGWWDQHTVGGPGVWKDEMYKSKNDFTHHSANKKEIVTWGEMLGAAVPDNHARMIREIESNGGESYDLADHKRILKSYNQFLDRWKFRESFPTAEDLFLNIGDKCYDFWGRVIETARLAEANDYLVISGWESTAIENHSGLLDNLRGFKGKPDLLKERFALIRPVIKTTSLNYEAGDNASVDIYLINETSKAPGKKLILSIKNSSGQKLLAKEFPVPEKIENKFVYLIDENVELPKFNTEGYYSIELQIDEIPNFTTREELLVLNTNHNFGRELNVGVICNDYELIKQVASFTNINAEKYDPNQNYDLIIVSSQLLYGWRSIVDPVDIKNTEDDELYWTESWGYNKNLEYVFTDLPSGIAKVTLKFAEVTLSGPEARVFDVAVNGKTVLENFDIYKEAGGKNSAIEKVFMTETSDGNVKITIPKRTVNYGKFSAIKIEAGDKVIAINCGGEPYTDKTGLTWEKYEAQINLTDDVIEKIKSGTNAILLPDGPEAADAYGNKLGETGIINYIGHVGSVRASWMGAWYFVKEHALMKGLPVNQAMKSYYQASVNGSDGLMLEGENIDAFIGFGRDHDTNIGVAGFTVNAGKGKIVFYSIPGMTGKGEGVHHIIAKKILLNSIEYLVE